MPSRGRRRSVRESRRDRRRDEFHRPALPARAPTRRRRQPAPPATPSTSRRRRAAGAASSIAAAAADTITVALPHSRGRPPSRCRTLAAGRRRAAALSRSARSSSATGDPARYSLVQPDGRIALQFVPCTHSPRPARLAASTSASHPSLGADYAAPWRVRTPFCARSMRRFAPRVRRDDDERASLKHALGGFAARGLHLRSELAGAS